jgi:aspartyl-tRNA(Asn)/glutamyl-tRNA(Gln) amidotransferase subunit A
MDAIAGDGTAGPATAVKPTPNSAGALQKDLAGMTVGIERSYFFYSQVSQEVVETVESAIATLASLGAQVVEVEVSNLDYAPAAGWAVLLADTSEWHRTLMRTSAHRYFRGTRVMLELGELLSAPLYVRAQRVRALIQRSIRRVFEANALDAVVAPTTPFVTIPIDVVDNDTESSPLFEFFHHSIVANVTGLPAITVACGFDTRLLPIGMQLIGRPWGEDKLLRIADAFQAVTGWHECSP